MKTRRLTLAISSLLAAILIPLYAYKSGTARSTDFEVFYRAALRLGQRQWDSIYTLADGGSPFRYAPPLLPLFLPFSALTFTHAAYAWYFCQLLWFGFGFYFVLRGLRAIGHSGKANIDPLWALALGFLFTLRFILDTFTIGQSSSLLFFFSALAFWGYLKRSPAKLAIGTLIPAVFKIGPAILFGLFFFLKPEERKKAFQWASASLVALLASQLLWVRALGGGWETTKNLWKSWALIVRSDSIYYDASHYGSQSLKSALLRLAHSGVLSDHAAAAAHWVGVLLFCLGVMGLWTLREPVGARGRAHFFSLGLYAVMVCMPETFKYSLTPLAIPAGTLFLCARLDFFSLTVLALSTAVLSLAGKDIVGDALFFGSQRASLPFLSVLALSALSAREALRNSARRLEAESQGLGPWEHPPLHPDPGGVPSRVSVLVPLALGSQSLTDPELIAETLREIHSAAQARFSTSEFLVSPYGECDSPEGQAPAIEAVGRLTPEIPGLRILPHAPGGRGAALREAFLESSGGVVVFGNLETPCRSEFFSTAWEMLKSHDFIQADRRSPESRFQIPVRILPYIFQRHRLGLRFSSIARALIGDLPRDTLSGIAVMKRSVALSVFCSQSCGGFLFDLEANLVVKARGFREASLPVRLFLQDEKRTLRVLGESWAILRELPRLALSYRRGAYGKPLFSKKITADDWGISPGVNRGILELARKGIVRRVSMMATTPYLNEGLLELREIPGLELGLHFNLTYGASQILPGTGPAGLLLRSFTAQSQLLSLAKAELERQLGLLKRSGVRPAYLDGHHHIHLLPGLIAAIAPGLQSAGITQVRLPLDRSLILSPKAPLYFLSLLARGKMERAGLRYFPCVYPPISDFGRISSLRKRLARAGDCEIITHPSRENDFEKLKIQDGYREGRLLEFRALEMIALDPQVSGSAGPT